MSSCNSCNVAVTTGTGGATSHGRPPKDLKDRTVTLDILEVQDTDRGKPPRDLKDLAVVVDIPGGLSTGSSCRVEYNKLLTSEVYKVVQLTSALYPLEMEDSIKTVGMLNSVDYWNMPHDEIYNVPIFSRVSLIDTVRYLDLNTDDQLNIGPVLETIKVVDAVRRLNVSTVDNLAVGPVLDKVALRFGARYVNYTYEDSLDVSVLLSRIAII